MRITIDARFFGPLGKGLGRYTQRLIEHLEKIDQRNQYTILLRRANWDEYQPQAPNFSKQLADYQWYSVAEQIGLPRVLYKLNSDIVHFPHFNVPLLYRRPFVVTVHDLIITTYPTQRATTLGPSLYKIKHWGYTAVIGHAVRNARTILTVSEYVKADLHRHFHRPSEAIVVTYEGTNPAQPGAANPAVLARHGLEAPYLLYVGNAYPHKNLERLIETFARLRRSHDRLQLVLVGRDDYFFQRLRQLVVAHGLISAVRFPGYIPDADLADVYRGATLYVFPSLAEGFGLPPLEAMSYGLPVVSSNTSCLPEILGTAAAYVNPLSVEVMHSVIDRLLRDPAEQQAYRQAGLERIKRFSWEQMARQTLSAYQQSVSPHASKT